jgi:transcriptional regulator with XRE-family HTH domain
MNKSTHVPEYEAVKSALVAMRQEAGLTQRDLAERLGREHSFIWRIENGERRVDVLEFCWICQAMAIDPKAAYSRLINRVASLLEKQARD